MRVSVCCVRVRPAHPPPPPLQPGTRQMPSLPPCRGQWSPAQPCCVSSVRFPLRALQVTGGVYGVPGVLPRFVVPSSCMQQLSICIPKERRSKQASERRKRKAETTHPSSLSSKLPLPTKQSHFPILGAQSICMRQVSPPLFMTVIIEDSVKI
ncbi:hypothetical protein CCHR01_09838 [Colletotrichum chrysophilum]|uniref:Uncharacterized protein n=1 Tax=Colletotrichum chrysophilum TaxID=1836956 RepID=A0AAD9EDU0_9PEZI|nr:hypothetical protein CCHR01_09838 [Colletotrichum chrysophilum]